MLHNTAQNSSDNLASYAPDNHQRSDVISQREGKTTASKH